MDFSTVLIITLIHGWGSSQSDPLVLLAEVIKPIPVWSAQSGLETGKHGAGASVVGNLLVENGALAKRSRSGPKKVMLSSSDNGKVGCWDAAAITWKHWCDIRRHQTASVPRGSSCCIYGKSDLTWMQHKPDWYIYSLLLILDAPVLFVKSLSAVTVYIYPNGHTERHNWNRIWLIWIFDCAIYYFFFTFNAGLLLCTHWFNHVLVD